MVLAGGMVEVIERREIAGSQDTAAVVDLPGAESVKTGLALARAGFRPVPLYNAATGCRPGALASAVIDMAPVCQWLVWGARILEMLDLAPEARPVFLLDSRRSAPEFMASPGRFDNRWVVFPQDFPSANFLKDHGIARVVLVSRTEEPGEDLAHVLLRWQQAGIDLQLQPVEEPASLRALVVRTPPRFKALFHRVLALAGLRRNSAGGFGSLVPEPSQG